MNRTTQQLANDVVARTAMGGGTFEASTLLPFEPKVGYAVGIGGARYPASAFTAEVAVWLGKAVATEYETSYFGTWLKDGTVYVDAVRYFGAHAQTDALLAGYRAGQEAIYDFAAGDVIILGEEVSA